MRERANDQFMQRAAATAAANEPPQSQAEDASPHTPKRARVSTGPGSPSPSTQPASELEAISAAVAAEDQKRKDAIARQAAEAGETEWVLDYVDHAHAPQPYVIAADSLDAEDEHQGRQAFGNFKRKNTEVRFNFCMRTLLTTQPERTENTRADAEGKSEKVRLSKLTSISGARPEQSDESPQRKRKQR